MAKWVISRRQGQWLVQIWTRDAEGLERPGTSLNFPTLQAARASIPRGLCARNPHPEEGPTALEVWE